MLSPLGFFLRSPKPGLRVLFYHRVNDHTFEDLGMVSRELSVHPASFERQLSFLQRKGFRSLTLDEAQKMLSGEMEIDRKAILITFDDGYLDNLQQAAPLLKRFGFTAVVFPVTELIGTNNGIWPMSDPPELGRFMDDEHLKSWIANGNEIGSHTCSHPVLTQLDDEALKTELSASRTNLETRFEKPCLSIAYPGGDVDSRVARFTEEAGYELGFTTQSGVNRADTPLHSLKRTEVSASDPFPLFRMKISGLFDWLGFRDTVAYRNFMRRLNRQHKPSEKQQNLEATL